MAFTVAMCSMRFLPWMLAIALVLAARRRTASARHRRATEIARVGPVGSEMHQTPDASAVGRLAGVATGEGGVMSLGSGMGPGLFVEAGRPFVEVCSVRTWVHLADSWTFSRSEAGARTPSPKSR